MHSDNQPRIYYIPENFSTESRFWQGRIRTRYFIDCVVLGFALGIFGILLVATVGADWGTRTRISVVLFSFAPGVLLGHFGYNGDPISRALKLYFEWQKGSRIQLYNPAVRLLGSDPIKAIKESNSTKDKMISKFLDFQEKRRNEILNAQWVEGETFTFAYDPGIDDYIDENGDFETEEAKAEETIVVPIGEEIQIDFFDEDEAEETQGEEDSNGGEQ